MVRAAIWQIAIALTALAALGGRATAQQPTAAAYTEAPETGSAPTVPPSGGVEEPPAVEPVPPIPPGTESVPPGESVPATPGENPDGMPLPPIADVLADGQPSTPVVSSNCWFAPDHWYGAADFMIINHDKPKRNTGIAIDAERTGFTFFQEQNLSLGITEGGRFTIGVWQCHDTYGWDHAIEASFVGATDWHKHFDFIAVTPGSIFTFPNTGIGGFNGADAAFLYYKSQLNSAGIDLRWTKRPERDKLEYDPCGYWKRAAEDGNVFSVFLGIHDTEFDERFTYATRRNNTPTNVFSGDYTTGTSNNIFGLHFGSELDYKHDLWYVGIRGGSTVGVNIAEVDSDLTFVDPMAGSGAHHENAFHTGPGAVSDLSLIAGWQIRPNVRLRVSYDFIWLTAIATAPGQIRLGAFQPQAIDVSRDQMFTAGSLGLEFNW